MKHLLEAVGIEARLDAHRGFDHGCFAPMAVMVPEADVPVIQLSLQTATTHERIARWVGRWRLCATKAC